MKKTSQAPHAPQLPSGVITSIDWNIFEGSEVSLRGQHRAPLIRVIVVAEALLVLLPLLTSRFLSGKGSSAQY